MDTWDALLAIYEDVTRLDLIANARGRTVPYISRTYTAKRRC